MSRTNAGWISALALASLPLACSSATQVDGKLSVQGSPVYGTWEAAADGCTHDRHGTVTLRAGGHSAQVVDGSVTLSAAADMSTAEWISGGSCATFAVSVDPGADGSAYYVDGQVIAHCTLPDGGTFDADVTFRNCPCVDCQCVGCPSPYATASSGSTTSSMLTSPTRGATPTS